MKVGPKDDTIEFLCTNEDYGNISEPIPASKSLPDWYKSIEPTLGENGVSTVKRCMPFLDAMTMGWIIPLAGDVHVDLTKDNPEKQFGWDFDKPLIDRHGSDQVGGDSNPMSPMSVIKFNNYWAIKVPDGYSVLFTAPLNRHEPRFQVFSGVVDCDKYINYINFPSVWTQPDFSGVLEKGTPLVQVIPVERDSVIGNGEIRSMTEIEETELQRIGEDLSVDRSLYRNKLRQPKNGSRIVSRK